MKKKIEKNKETNESIESHEEKVLSEREKNKLHQQRSKCLREKTE